MCARWHRGYAYIGWKIGWKIAPIVQISSSHYFADTQHVMRRMEDMVDFFAKHFFLTISLNNVIFTRLRQEWNTFLYS